MVRVLIVDDHFIVRQGIRLILETNDKYEVIGEAGNGQEALSLLQSKTPDLILLDLYMPILDGLSLLKTLNDQQYNIPVIVLTTYNEDHLLVEAIDLGAKGYLLKDTGRERLFLTMEATLRGEILLQPDVLKRLLIARTTPKLLSDKELEILKEIAKGCKSIEIASQMGIAERTVKAYLTMIYNKLGVNNRSEAVAVAMEKKYI